MIKQRAALLFLGVVLFLPLAVASAQNQSGHTNWGRWRFDWEIRDDAGIAIRNVYFDNELVIYKASMPVIRVQYFNCPNCGPYADRLNWSNMVQISDCNNQKVCQRSFLHNGKLWLELGVLSRIGQYRIYQVWYFNNDGVINPQLYSRGLHHQADHNHHVYWRLDFDVNGAGNDQIFVFDNNRPNQGWGPGWHLYSNEVNDTKSPWTARVWFVRDNATGHGVWVMPGSHDGTIDGFSNKDMGGRRYQGSEDTGWPFGAWGHLGYWNGESIAKTDIVFWYVSHMFHRRADGEYLWHSSGPILRVAR